MKRRRLFTAAAAAVGLCGAQIVIPEQLQGDWQGTGSSSSTYPSDGYWWQSTACTTSATQQQHEAFSITDSMMYATVDGIPEPYGAMLVSYDPASGIMQLFVYPGETKCVWARVIGSTLVMVEKRYHMICSSLNELGCNAAYPCVPADFHVPAVITSANDVQPYCNAASLGMDGEGTILDVTMVHKWERVTVGTPTPSPSPSPSNHPPIRLPTWSSCSQSILVRGCVAQLELVSYALPSLPQCLGYTVSLNPGPGDVDIMVAASFPVWYDYAYIPVAPHTSAYGPGQVDTVTLSVEDVLTYGPTWYIGARGYGGCTGYSGCGTGQCAYSINITAGPAYTLVTDNGQPSASPTPLPSRLPQASRSAQPSRPPVVVVDPGTGRPHFDQPTGPLNDRSDFIGDWTGFVSGNFAYSISNQRYECVPVTMKTNVPHTVHISDTTWVDGPWNAVQFWWGRSGYMWHAGTASTFTWAAANANAGLYRLSGSTEQDCHFARVFGQGPDRELLWVSLIGTEYGNGASCNIDAFQLPQSLSGAGSAMPFCHTTSPMDATTRGQTVVRRYRLASSLAQFRGTDLDATGAQDISISSDATASALAVPSTGTGDTPNTLHGASGAGTAAVAGQAALVSGGVGLVLAML